MNQVREIGRSYTIELPILSNTNRKFSFGDNETGLDNVLVTGISIVPDFFYLSPNGRAIYPTQYTGQGMITLADANKKELNKQVPLEIFLRADSVIHIKPKIISIRNSYVDLPLIANVGPIPPAGYAIVFTFYFDDFNPLKHKVNALGDVEEIEEY